MFAQLDICAPPPIEPSRSEEHAIEAGGIGRGRIQDGYGSRAVGDLKGAPVGLRKIGCKLNRKILSARAVNEKLESLAGEARSAAQGGWNLVYDEVDDLVGARGVSVLVGDVRIAALAQSLLVKSNTPNTLETQHGIISA